MAVGPINRAQSRVSSQSGAVGGGGLAKMNSKSFCAKVLTTILVICSSRQCAGHPGILLGPEKDAKTITTTGEDNNKDNDRRRFQRNLFALR